MKYEDLKKDLVDDKHLLTSRQLMILVLKILAIVVALDLMIGTLCIRTVGFPVTILVFIASLFFFSTLMEYIIETEDRLKFWRKLSSCWFLFYIAFVVEMIIMGMLNL